MRGSPSERHAFAVMSAWLATCRGAGRAVPCAGGPPAPVQLGAAAAPGRRPVDRPISARRDGGGAGGLAGGKGKREEYSVIAMNQIRAAPSRRPGRASRRGPCPQPPAPASPLPPPARAASSCRSASRPSRGRPGRPGRPDLPAVTRACAAALRSGPRPARPVPPQPPPWKALMPPRPPARRPAAGDPCPPPSATPASPAPCRAGA